MIKNVLFYKKNKSINNTIAYALFAKFLILILLFNSQLVYSENPTSEVKPTTTPINLNPVNSLPFQTKDEVDLKLGLVKSAKGIAICVAILFLILYLIKKLPGANISNQNKKRIKIVERVFINSKSSILLIDFDGEDILCGVTPENITFFKKESKKISFEESMDSLNNINDLNTPKT